MARTLLLQLELCAVVLLEVPMMFCLGTGYRDCEWCSSDIWAYSDL